MRKSVKRMMALLLTSMLLLTACTDLQLPPYGLEETTDSEVTTDGTVTTEGEDSTEGEETAEEATTEEPTTEEPTTEEITDAEGTTDSEETMGEVTTEPSCAASGHSWGAWSTVSEPTCTANGKERRECDNCDHYEEQDIAATGHSYNSVITAPSCTEQGYTTHTCSCGDSKVDTYVAAQGHSYGKWNTTSSPDCETTGKEKRICANCDHYQERDIDATGHKYKATVTDPTCTEQGYTTHTCDCGDSYVDSYVAARGHIEVADVGYSATCTEPGMTNGSHCSACNSVITVQTIIPALGHSYSTDWSSDATYHWHSAICEHSSEISDKAKHTYDANNICIVCEFFTRLDTPVIDRVEYDVIYWNEVEHADMYLVRVNGDYEYKTRSTSCDLSLVKNSEGKALTVSTRKAPIQIKVQVMALVSGQYAASEWSVVDSSYTYVPAYSNNSTVATLTGYKIGYGYNLVEDEYLKITNASSLSVFDVSKLLTLGRYNVTPNAAGASTYYSYSSVDEFIAKSEAGFDVSMNLNIPMAGTLKAHMNYVGSEHFKNYAYNQTFVADVAVTVEDHELLDLRDEYLQYCLSFDFLDVLNRRTLATEHMSDAELVAYIYQNYGTHVILGVTTGGSYTAQYTVSTNEETIATSLKKVVETGMNVNFDDIFGVDIGVDLTASGENSWKTQTTEAHFKTRFTGSTGGATFDPSPSSLTSAVKEWQNKISPTSVRFTKNGAISMASLIRTVDSGLADAFEAYVDERSDDTYKEMYGQYEKNLTRLISAPVVENGKNVIRIDLSSFQRSGSMENAYDPNFLENILTIYPIMYGTKIDTIIISGGFDGATGQQNLINGFSVKLSKEWNRNVEIVVENLGVICASDYGLIDTSAITKNINVTVNYVGANMIQETDGEYHFYAQKDDTTYEFIFDPTNIDNIDFTTTNMEADKLSIPIANRDNYAFVGWYAGDTQVTDSLGVLLSSYATTGERVTLKAKWDTITYTITLNDQRATTPGTEKFYQKYTVGFFSDFENGTPIEQITIPTRTGYVFGGYYASVSENATANAVGNTQYINEQGEIIRDTKSFTRNTMLYALWLPTVYTITLDNDGATSAGSSAYYQRYEDGVYLDEACTQVGAIQIPTKPGYTFAGYYMSVTNNNTMNASGSMMCVDAGGVIVAENTQFTQDVTLYALWTQNILITLNHEEADTTGLTVLYPKTDDGVYEDITLEHRIYVITIPTKEGYMFGGYYEQVSNNNTLKALGDTQVVSPSGEINPTIMHYTESVELHALWIKDTVNLQMPQTARSVKASEPVVDTVILPWDLETLHTIGCTGFMVTVKNCKTSVSAMTMCSLPMVYASSISGSTLYNEFVELGIADYTFNFFLPIEKLENVNKFAIRWMVGIGGWKLTGGEISITAVYGDKTNVSFVHYGTIVQQTQIKVYGQPYGTLPTPTRKGYTFDGWYLNDELITSESVVNTREAHTLVAKWIPNTYSIVYNANGGTGSMGSNDKCTYGKNITLLTNNYTRFGYVFTGWNTKADGSGFSYANEESVSIATTNDNDTVILYAQWDIIDTYTITYNDFSVGRDDAKGDTIYLDNYFNLEDLRNLGYSNVTVVQTFNVKATWTNNKGGYVCNKVLWGGRSLWNDSPDDTTFDYTNVHYFSEPGGPVYIQWSNTRPLGTNTSLQFSFSSFNPWSIFTGYRADYQITNYSIQIIFS